MNKKIVGILVCTLLIAAAVLPVVGMINEECESKAVSNEEEWFWKEPFPNYAPHIPGGMPDFNQSQPPVWWGSVCEPIIGGNGIADTPAIGDDIQVVAVGNPVNPGDVIVAPGPDCYLDTWEQPDDEYMWAFCGPVSVANCFWWFDSQFADPDGTPGDGEDQFPLVEDYGVGDDHAADNVPLLIENLAIAMETNINGNTPVNNMENAINDWLVDTGLDDTFEVNVFEAPTWGFIKDEVMRSQNVILQLGQYDDVDGTCIQRVTHYVTCAGVTEGIPIQIAFSDPFFDIEDPSSSNHNDAQFVSHDIYGVRFQCPCSNLDFEWRVTGYPPNEDFDWTFVEFAVVICPIENEPPEAPSIDGPTSGEVGTPHTYVFNAVDPDGDNVRYIIDWDDGDAETTAFNPSGTDVQVQHTWSEEGTYIITASAEDTEGLVGPEATLTVDMPRNKIINIPFLNFLQSHPNLFPIFQRLIMRLGLQN